MPGLGSAVSIDLDVLDRDVVPGLEHGLVVTERGGAELHDGARPDTRDGGRIGQANARDHARPRGKLSVLPPARLAADWIAAVSFVIPSAPSSERRDVHDGRRRWSSGGRGPRSAN